MTTRKLLAIDFPQVSIRTISYVLVGTHARTTDHSDQDNLDERGTRESLAPQYSGMAEPCPRSRGNGVILCIAPMKYPMTEQVSWSYPGQHDQERQMGLFQSFQSYTNTVRIGSFKSSGVEVANLNHTFEFPASTAMFDLNNA